MSDDIPLLVDPEWLAARLGEPDLVILDCSTRLEPDPAGGPDRNIAERAEFLAAHIPGARFADMVSELSDPAGAYPFTAPQPEAFAAAVERLGVGPDSRVVLYASGNPWWATRAWWVLRLYGFDRAGVLDGGFKAWRAAGLPVEAGEPAPSQPVRFPARPPRPLIATASDVLAAIGSDAGCVVNALPAARFRGEGATSLPRAGRIAGSISLPGAETIDPATGKSLPLDVIEARFRAAGLFDKPVIAYCGGGVTATWIAFLLARMGGPEPLIYDHSLQEWTVDPSLPMATG
ncbi:sulfurtransferase [Kaistia sp. 32K]|uniref:sulfurtransferase n=1 Tax=Kaistia sp. 32K TaxID=2795690 RepID=UPI0019156073|nr:sulfurtransferase [Kaistia sp. 32K]BCP52224.1 sulfurtransferase [Kaistia sp. 32K]